ncbi:MAG: DNA replication and repair protein RecF [Bacteroidales bacterium]|nr:DNA replication and repair protein RecF [Bacteroidales bacterium]
MILKNLSVYHYRNIEEMSFSCNETVNCLIGMNGVGKTNILDAIYYLSFCKSFLQTNDAANVKNGEKSFLIQGNYDVEDVQLKISCAYNQDDKSKIIKCNEKKYTRFSDHIGILPLVFVSPSDISLINEGGSERRKFLDTFISMYNREYFSNLLVYSKLLQQRNSLLKQEGGFDETYLSILDEKLSILGLAIYQERKKVVEILSQRTNSFYSEIAETEECTISYESQLDKGDMRTLLAKNLEKDKILTYTSVGIHRDDLQFYFDGNLVKSVASQGQKKSFLLALKFSQYQLIKEFKNGQKPILLLDDLFDKLDKQRAKNIFDIVEKQDFGQIFITDTDKMLLHDVFKIRQSSGIFWNVESGGAVKPL